MSIRRTTSQRPAPVSLRRSPPPARARPGERRPPAVALGDTFSDAVQTAVRRHRLEALAKALRTPVIRAVGAHAKQALLELARGRPCSLPEPKPQTQPWHVEWGQTLTGIALSLQAQGVPGTVADIIADICALNGIENPDLIEAGSTLQVPAPPRGSPGVTPRPDAPRGASGERYDVPYISQMSSEGTEDDWNAASNCGPTSMAMIARAFGFGDGMSDGALVNMLGGFAGVGADGVGYTGIMTMAASLGLDTTYNPGADTDWIAAQLEQGNLVAANGDRAVTLQNESPPWASGTATGGHWIVVTGMTPDGNFLVQDPSTTCRVLTPAELSRFLASNSNGGYAVSVSPP